MLRPDTQEGSERALALNGNASGLIVLNKQDFPQ